MNKFFKKFYWILIVFVIVGLDQITKYLIVSNLKLYEEITIIPNFFTITHVHNEGIAFGMLSKFGLFSKIAVILLTFVMIVMATFLILKRLVTGALGIVCVSFIIGGGIGNLIDRVVLRYVIDFFAFTFWGKDFAIFNVADIFVTVGTILFIFYFLFLQKDEPLVKGKDDGNQEL